MRRRPQAAKRWRRREQRLVDREVTAASPHSTVVKKPATAIAVGAIACISALAILLGPPIGAATAAPSTTTTDSTGSVDAIATGVELEGPVSGVEPAANPSRVGANSIPSGSPFWELQMNLCNSGHADCYKDGKAIDEAADRIESSVPDLVTLNEICFDDIAPLYSSIRSLYGSYDATFWAFVPAFNGDGDPVKCTNGQNFGNGLVGRMFTTSPDPQLDAYGWIYGPQDDGNEKRTALCARVHNSYWGCTTHLSNRSRSVAMDQCQQLMSDILPSLWSNHGYLPSVMGGDLNLYYADFFRSPNVQDCVPSGWYRKGDGSVQHVMFRNIFSFRSSTSYPMEHTDHPAWLVRTVYNP